jgi:release factor glutamine methyltransferase
MRTISLEIITLKPEPRKLSIAETVAQATTELANYAISTPRLDAEVLLAHTLGLSRARLYAQMQEVISESQVQRFHYFLYRRQQREPLQYITGIQEFWSLEFYVTPDVLIPRPETELVVEATLTLLDKNQMANGKWQKHQEAGGWRLETSSPLPSSLKPQASSLKGSDTGHRALRLLDIGTGSGCIAIALATELLQAEIWATDISPAALTIAKENAQRHGVADRIHFLHGDLFTPLADQQLSFDLIVANPPYIAHNDIPLLQPEVRKWEPRSALDGGSDGLDFYRRLLNQSSDYLRPDGYLVMEIGHGQRTDILRLAQQQPDFIMSLCLRDYEGRERIVWTQKQTDKSAQK